MSPEFENCINDVENSGAKKPGSLSDHESLGLTIRHGYCGESGGVPPISDGHLENSKWDIAGSQREQPSNLKTAKRQQVYIISRADGAIKIGISIRPRTRMSDLQMATPDKLAIVKTYKPTSGTAAAAEAAFKKLMLPRRISGEWFACAADFAEIVVEAILENDAIKLSFAEKYLVTLQEYDLADAARLRSKSRWDEGEFRKWAHDGTRILAYAPSKKRFAVTWWRKPEDNAGFIGWGEFNQTYWPATMWWPLPPTH